MGTLRIIRYAFLSGARDYGSIYTWKTWLGGWFLRVLAQVTGQGEHRLGGPGGGVVLPPGHLAAEPDLQRRPEDPQRREFR